MNGLPMFAIMVCPLRGQQVTVRSVVNAVKYLNGGVHLASWISLDMKQSVIISSVWSGAPCRMQVSNEEGANNEA